MFSLAQHVCRTRPAPVLETVDPINEEDVELGQGLPDELADEEPARDLSWVPSFAQYRARCLRRLKKRANSQLNDFDVDTCSLPAGLPTQIESPFVWSGSELVEADYVVQLQENDIRELEDALRHFQGDPF
jgi:hypothetical protein